MRLAVVLVHYHTPELAAAAVAALAADLAGSGVEAEWLLVDNGSDEAGRALLATLPVERIDPGANLGYAGGVNLGVARSRAELLLLMNPDVLVLPGCTAALLDSLGRGAAAAGPRFYWDGGRRLLLPPAERRGRRRELAALLARRGGVWAARARLLSRRHCRRHWEATAPLPSHALSGSLLAVRRAAWERVGPFDPGYPLYFEETDWLLRLRRARLPARYVPAAEAVHLYAQSALGEPRSRQWFEASARRFRRRNYGAWFSAALEAMAGGARGGGPAGEEASPLDAPLMLAGLGGTPPLWVEVSPNPEGYPAAAERLAAPAPAEWRLPPEIARRLPAGTRLWARVCDAAGRELGGATLLADDERGERGERAAPSMAGEAAIPRRAP